jgi:hypothetical protein
MVQWSVRASRPLLAVALTLLGLAWPGTARADLVTFNSPGLGETVTITFTGPHDWSSSDTGTGFAGQLNMTGPSGSFLAFCGDLNHMMGPNGTSYDVAVSSLPAGANVGAIAFLTNKYLTNPNATLDFAANTSEGEAAVQLAIWSLEYPGLFTYSGAQGPPTSVVNDFIGEAVANAGGTVVFQAWIGEGTEGQGILTPGTPAPPVSVPEPSSILLLGVGLVGLVAYRRRGPRNTLAVA